MTAGPLAALGALVAAAGPFDGTQRLDAATGVVVSSSRVVGLAGAYAAVAEGLDGVRSNPGSYLEPSRTLGPLRPHATFGADVRLHLHWDFRVGLAGDLASRYQNLSLSLGLWRDSGPRPPPPAGS